MFDMFEMMTIQASNDAIAVAANKAMEASALLPGLPQIDTRVLQAAKMGAQRRGHGLHVDGRGVW